MTELQYLSLFIDWLERQGKVTESDVANFADWAKRRAKASKIAHDILNGVTTR